MTVCCSVVQIILYLARSLCSSFRVYSVLAEYLELCCRAAGEHSTPVGALFAVVKLAQARIVQ